MSKNIFSPQAREALKHASVQAESMQHTYIGTEHILLGLLEEGKSAAAYILTSAGVKTEKIMEMLDELVAPEHQDVTGKPEFSVKSRSVLERAHMDAHRLGFSVTGTEHILLSLLQEQESIAARILFTLGTNLEQMMTDLLRTMQVPADRFQRETGKEGVSALEQYGRDLTLKAREKQVDPVIGREKEIDRIIQILSRRTKNNPCLIGDPGVGKTAVVEGLAQRISAGTVPAQMRGKRLVVLDLTGMVAGSKYRGEFEERIKRVLDEVKSDRQILLFIDEIHTIIGAGSAEGSLDASNILKPALSRGEIQLIGATTREEYRKYIEKDSALERRFQPVAVEEPTQEQAYEILEGLRSFYESHHGVRITDEALYSAVSLGRRYITDRFLPDKAIDLIDETAARIQMAGYDNDGHQEACQKEMQTLEESLEAALRKNDILLAKQYAGQIEVLRKEIESFREKAMRGGRTRKTVDADDIADTVALWTKIPVARLKEAESKRLIRMEKILGKRVIGQSEAIAAVSKAIRRGRVGLKDPSRPVGSFLFLGPTGVGKTELSKALAEAVFGDEKSMIRLDMSEYMDKYSASKLIGSPPGYVGYDEGGQLSEKVRNHPYSVVLFDEIEKAHPEIFNLLLQILDDGRLTDAQGRTVSFKDTIIIMTSNTGASDITKPKHLGFITTEDAAATYQAMKDRVMESVRMTFRPEFLNRIDDIIVFHPLSKEEMKKIISILLSDVEKRCFENLSITLRISEKAKEFIIDKSFDEKYGARPLKREIQNRIENELADRILSGEIQKHAEVNIGIRNGALVWKTENAKK